MKFPVGGHTAAAGGDREDEAPSFDEGAGESNEALREAVAAAESSSSADLDTAFVAIDTPAGTVFTSSSRQANDDDRDRRTPSPATVALREKKRELESAAQHRRRSKRDHRGDRPSTTTAPPLNKPQRSQRVHNVGAAPSSGGHIGASSSSAFVLPNGTVVGTSARRTKRLQENAGVKASAGAVGASAAEGVASSSATAGGREGQAPSPAPPPAGAQATAAAAQATAFPQGDEESWTCDKCSKTNSGSSHLVCRGCFKPRSIEDVLAATSVGSASPRNSPSRKSPSRRAVVPPPPPPPLTGEAAVADAKAEAERPQDERDRDPVVGPPAVERAMASAAVVVGASSLAVGTIIGGTEEGAGAGGESDAATEPSTGPSSSSDASSFDASDKALGAAAAGAAAESDVAVPVAGAMPRESARTKKTAAALTSEAKMMTTSKGIDDAAAAAVGGAGGGASGGGCCSSVLGPRGAPTRKRRAVGLVVALLVIACGAAAAVVFAMNGGGNDGGGQDDDGSSNVLGGGGAPAPETSTSPSGMPVTSEPTPRPSVTPSSKPSSGPSGMPSSVPSSLPSLLPSSKPSLRSSNRPSLSPSSNPTRAASASPSDQPTGLPSSSPTDVPPYTFYLMGDIPYTQKEEELLASQLRDINASVAFENDNAAFVVHVGDFMSAQHSQCSNEKFARVSQIFRDHSPLPVLATPGDNDWNDCPNPNQAWNRFQRHFLSLESEIVEHDLPLIWDENREENVAFLVERVLVVMTNLVGGNNRDDEWDARILGNVQFTVNQLDAHEGSYDAAFLIGHSRRPAYLSGIKARMEETGIPVVYIHGDKHEWAVNQDYASDGDDEGWDLFWDVTVDQGAIAPPVRVSFRRSGGPPLVAESADHFVFGDGGHIMIDRRGGAYA